MKITHISLRGETPTHPFIRWAARKPTVSPISPMSELNESLRYLDTVTLRFPIRLTHPKEHGLRVITEEQDSGFELHHYRRKVRISKGSTVFIRYIDHAYDTKSYLYLTFSLPKLVIGTNACMIPSTLNTLQELNKQLISVFEILSISPLNILLAVLCRIDISVNFHVGSQGQDYVDHVRHQAHPYRRTRDVFSNASSYVGDRGSPNDNGVEFKNKITRTVVYNKWLECREAASKGVIRLEVSHRTSRAVERLFNRKKPTLASLTRDFVRDVLHKEMAIFGLDRTIHKNGSTAVDLTDQVGTTKAAKLLFHIQWEQAYPGLPSKIMAQLIGCSVKTVNKWRKVLQELGISPTVPETITLPALTLEMSSPPEKIGVDVHSNTLPVSGDTIISTAVMTMHV